MDYTITIDKNRHIVVARVSGVLDWENAQVFSREVRETARQHGYNILVDLRQSSMETDIYEIYRFPRESETLKDPSLKSIKMALLVSHGKDEFSYEFYQETAQSAGVPTRVFFDDEQAALEWLTGTGPNQLERPTSW